MKLIVDMFWLYVMYCCLYILPHIVSDFARLWCLWRNGGTWSISV